MGFEPTNARFAVEYVTRFCHLVVAPGEGIEPPAGTLTACYPHQGGLPGSSLLPFYRDRNLLGPTTTPTGVFVRLFLGSVPVVYDFRGRRLRRTVSRRYQRAATLGTAIMLFSTTLAFLPLDWHMGDGRTCTDTMPVLQTGALLR